MKNILITGGAGFIGSNLVEVLHDIGKYRIFVMDIKKNPVNIQHLIDDRDVIYINQDILDTQEIYNIVNNNEFDGIVHLAAVSRVVWCEENPDLCVSTNVGGISSILEAMSKKDRKPWFIFGSSREVYGEQEVLPVKETATKVPINLYGRTKLEGEKFVCYYSGKHHINSIIMRFSNVYGNEKDILDRVIPRFVLKAIRRETLEIHGGNQVFDFTYIGDTVKAILNGIRYLESLQEVGFCEDVHILTGIPTRIIDLPNIISKYVGYGLDVKFTKPRDYDVDKFYGDPMKAKRFLSFEAKINIEEGLALTVKKFREVFK